jgi:hypothetical protein
MTFELPQTVTRWRPSADAGDGSKTWAAPEAGPARHATNTEEVQNARGENIVPENAIYTELDVQNGDFVALGDQTANATPTADARQAIRVKTNVSYTSLRRVLA